MSEQKLREVMDAVCRGEMPKGVVARLDKATTDDDWAKLNPNSLETECRDCGAYYTKEWAEGEQPPEKLSCPECGSSNHGGVGSPAGGMHLALWDSRLP